LYLNFLSRDERMSNGFAARSCPARESGGVHLIVADAAD
jgi:hypothetical protein